MSLSCTIGFLARKKAGPLPETSLDFAATFPTVLTGNVLVNEVATVLAANANGESFFPSISPNRRKTELC